MFQNYNVCTATGRPSNSYDGLNLAALPPDKRKLITPRNNRFVLYDYSSYHVYLIADILNYNFPQEDVHGYLMNEYGIDDRSEAKKITFRQLYGGVEPRFKRIEFLGDSTVRYEFLSSTLFNDYDIHLVFTGVTRNSKKILKKITENLEKVKPLLNTCDEAYDTLIQGDNYKFLELLNKSWSQKKATTSIIVESKTIRQMDEVLANNNTVKAHRLCGAGNGGFFLTFSRKDTLNIPYKSVRINVEPGGVYGESI